jgi:hypothetical protein
MISSRVLLGAAYRIQQDSRASVSHPVGGEASSSGDDQFAVSRRAASSVRGGRCWIAQPGPSRWHSPWPAPRSSTCCSMHGTPRSANLRSFHPNLKRSLDHGPEHFLPGRSIMRRSFRADTDFGTASVGFFPASRGSAQNRGILPTLAEIPALS